MSFRVDCLPRRLPLVGVLLLALSGGLSGCGDSYWSPPPELVAGETAADTLKRYLTPKSYWRAKVAQLEQQADQAAEEARKARKAYSEALTQRREGIQSGMKQARKSGADLWAARRKAINENRQHHKAMQQLSREWGREWKIRLEKLNKAYLALDQAPW
ncbi:MAG: hypothetical protein HQL56_09125 [Magnetococcales bacterium]|nr:hypothetical protein [Magnetococcales bacterium]